MVASYVRDPRFESSHPQFYLPPINCIINCVEKTKIKGKYAGNGPKFFLKNCSNACTMTAFQGKLILDAKYTLKLAITLKWPILVFLPKYEFWII